VSTTMMVSTAFVGFGLSLMFRFSTASGFLRLTRWLMVLLVATAAARMAPVATSAAARMTTALFIALTGRLALFSAANLVAYADAIFSFTTTMRRVAIGGRSRTAAAATFVLFHGYFLFLSTRLDQMKTGQGTDQNQYRFHLLGFTKSSIL